LAARPPCIRDNPNAIGHEGARGAEPRQSGAQDAPGWTVLVETGPLLVFACCAMLFHFANAPLLPLLGSEAGAGKAAILLLPLLATLSSFSPLSTRRTVQS